MGLAKRPSSGAPVIVASCHRGQSAGSAHAALVGKSGTLDAENTARAVLASFAGFATAEPETADGTVEMIRQLKVAHDTAVKDRSAAMMTLKAMLIHAPEQLRSDMAKKTQIILARHLAALRPTTLQTPQRQHPTHTQIVGTPLAVC